MKDKWDEIIRWIEKNSNESNAYIDISTEEGDYPRLISGNPDGLRLLAAELLRRSTEVEEGYLVRTDIPDAKWVLNDTLPLSITGLNETREKIIENTPADKEIENKSAVGDWGCLVIVLFVATLLILGVIYLINLF